MTLLILCLLLILEYLEVINIIKPRLFLAREKDIRYSIDSWKDGYFYLHTNKNAEDHKILRCKKDNLNKFEEYIPARKGTIVGSFACLDQQ